LKMLEFDSFQLDPERRELRRDGKPVPVQAKLFDTLVLLAENRDRIVDKQEILDTIWPDVHVEESTLFQTVSALRKVLGCGKAGGDRYIATIPGRGYRFVAAAMRVAPGAPRLATESNGVGSYGADTVSAAPVQRAATGVTASEASVHIENAERPPPPRGESLEPGAHRWWWTAAGFAVAAIILIAGALWWSSGSTQPEPANLRIQRLTSLDCVEWQPGWSPDGRSLAYAASAFGSADIFVRATAGGDPLRRTFDPADDLHPRWSPDGRYIAFLSDRGTGASVYVVSPYEGAERKVAETRLHRDVVLLSGLGAQPWSQDSESLLFPRRHADGSVAVWKVRLTTGEETQITHPPPGGEDREASWSFDGKQIAFRGERDGQEGIWIADAQGQVKRRAADSGNWPAWSPDDGSLYVSTARGGPKNIWRVELGTGAWHQVTRGAGQDMYPAIAPNGVLAFSNFRHTLHIHRTHLSSGKSERLIAGTGRRLQARVSPDGKRLVYQSGRTGEPEIWVLDFATGQELQLTDHTGPDTRPDWSPDGKQIVFLSRRDGAWRLWIVDSNGGTPKRLSANSIPVFDMRTATIEGNAEPRWSPDGDRIGYIAPTEHGFAVWLASLDGSTEAFTSTAGAVNFGWYLDGDRVIFTRVAEDGVFEMTAMNLTTGRERILHRGPHYELAVAPNGRAVSFSHNVSHSNQNLYVLRLTPPDPADGLPRPLGKPEQITDGKGIWHVHNGGWFPDGESVVYTRDTDHADIFLAEIP
jgi:Tol biopolymer transport system component/DNA-binding winged helix-turn-helix (wHTH) protein